MPLLWNQMVSFYQSYQKRISKVDGLNMGVTEQHTFLIGNYILRSKSSELQLNCVLSFLLRIILKFSHILAFPPLSVTVCVEPWKTG